MKLSKEQLAQLDMMTGYFNKIEKIAERMGVEVDGLVDEFKQHNSTVYFNLKQNLLAIANKRQQIFKHGFSGDHAGQTSIVNLHVIVNEERF